MCIRDRSWTKICDNIGTGERCLRAANGRLLLGINGSTYEFIKNATGEFSSKTLLSNVQGQMLDACEANGRAYIMTASTLYEEEKAVVSGSNYVCCTGGDNNIHLYTSSSHTSYTPREKEMCIRDRGGEVSRL